MSAGSFLPEDFESFSRKGEPLHGGDKPIPRGESDPESISPEIIQDCPPEEGLLDQLVDGELSEAQKRQVLQQVQNHPDGWRRLALAFLEAQAWKEEMARLVVGQMPNLSPTPKTPIPEKPVRTVSQHRVSSPAWQILALAGGILCAFLGGYLVRDFWATIQPGSPEGAIVQGPAPLEKLQKGTGFSEQELRGKEFPEPSERLAASGWEYVTLTAGTGPDGVPEVVRVPVSPAVPQIRFSPGPPPIPEEVLHLLRRWGAEVSHRRQFIPLRIEDGRQVVVPVEQVELYYRPQSQRFQ